MIDVRTHIHRPIAVTMTLIAIVTLGILALSKLPISLMPDIDIPQITVQMSSPGASAREVEERMVNPLRQQLSQVAGLKDIETSSRLDGGIISLSFAPGSDMSLIFIEVNEKIDRAMNLMPKDMERPKVMKMGALDIPAFYIDITSAKETIPMHEMSRLARNVISKRIEQLPEVAMVDMSGTVGTQIMVRPDDNILESLGLTYQDIENAINENNIILEALTIRDGIYRYNIHFDSQILTVSDIEDIYLRHEGRLIQLKELCQVTEEPAPIGGIVKSKNKDAVTLAIIKQNDAQMSDLKNSIDHLLSEMKSDYPNLDFEITRDQTRLLSYSMENLEWNMVLGAIMACLVLFVFLGGWKMPLLVAISIPLSIIVTILCIYMMGISLNIISLSGLILGVGMIVDNAIIVIDNIKQKGICNDQNVVNGVKEVFMPMLSSVLTTCSVFIPLVFLSGTAGALFHDQAIAVAFALFSSLFVASMVVPVYYYALFKKKNKQKTGGTHNDKQDKQISTEPSLRIDKWLMRKYERILGWCFRHQKTVVVIFCVCVVFIIVLFPFMRKERMPEIAHDDTLVYIDWNEGITIEENEHRMEDLTNLVAGNIETSTTMAGVQGFMLPHTKDITGSEAVCYIKAKSEDSLNSIKTILNTHIASHYPNAKIEYGIAASVFDMIFSTDMPDLEVRLYKKEGGRPTVDVARRVTSMLQKEYPHLEIQPIATESVIRYTANPEMMAHYKVDYRQLHDRLRQLLKSSHIFDISSGGENIPIVLSSKPGIGLGAQETEHREESERLLMHSITNKDGVDIPLMYLLSPSRGEDYKRLSAGSEGEYVPIRIAHADDYEISNIISKVKDMEEKSGDIVGEAISASFTGNYFESRELIKELAVILVVSLLLLYCILAIQFESIIQPIIILIEVAIDICVVMGFLFIMGESLNIMSMIGLVVMSGIIINDSILKVDTINQLRLLGMPLKKAMIVAGHRRLKPILMTSLTTILAIIPFIWRNDMGSALQYPLSITLIVGMTAGTFVSLFFVPLMYYIIYRKRA